MTDRRLPVYRPQLGERERRYLLEAFDSGWISSKGDFVNRFEQAFARYVGSSRAVSVCNGTVALHVALVALRIGLGDEVIVPTFTYVASVNMIRLAGATPVFADSDPATWQVDPADVERRITSKTRAIMAVHLYGQACDMDAIGAIARRRGLLIVEDCAEAFGTRIGERHAGTFGDVATYSFFGNKTITTGEGGMVVARDDAIAERVALLKNQAVSREREYWHVDVGFNYRMTNLQAAIGLAQIEQADELLAAKRRIAMAYRDALRGLPLEFHDEQPGSTHSYWMVSLLAPDEGTRDRLRHALAQAGVETRPTFVPAHQMPMYASESAARYPVAESLGARGINLPSWPGLSDDDVAQVCAVIRDSIAASAPG
jgi:perosamine synthetase